MPRADGVVTAMSINTRVVRILILWRRPSAGGMLPSQRSSDLHGVTSVKYIYLSQLVIFYTREGRSIHDPWPAHKVRLFFILMFDFYLTAHNALGI